MKNKLGFYIVEAILLAVIICMWFYFQNRMKQDLEVLGQFQLKETKLIKERDALEREISTYKANILTLKQLKASGDSTILAMKKELKYWKDIASHTTVGTTTTDTLIVEAHDTIWLGKDSIPVYAKKFTYQDSWMNLHGMIVKSQVELSYSLHNEMTLDYYWKRDHWYSHKYLAGTITQANPNTTTNRVVQFTVIKPPEPWYGKWWVHEIVGFGIGYATTMYILNK